MRTSRVRTNRAVSHEWRALIGIAAGAPVGVLVGLALTTLILPAGIAPPRPVVTLGLPIARLIMDLAALTTVGLAIVPWLISVDTSPRGLTILVAARRISALSAAVWAIAALTSLLLETADEYAGVPITFRVIGQYIEDIGSGQAEVTVAGAALLSVLLAVLSIPDGERVPPELRLAVTLFGLLPMAVTGHAADAGAGLRYVTMISMALHVVAAVAWTGGLLATVLLAMRDREILATALPQYSKIATVCVLVVPVTGLVNGLVELYDTPGVVWYLALFTTGYGQIMLLKGVCLVIAALLGAHIRFRLLPAIRRRARTAVLRWASLELTVIAVAFGLAAVLVRAPVITGT